MKQAAIHLYDRKAGLLTIAKEELYARMNESHIGDIVFGTICGTISAGIG